MPLMTDIKKFAIARLKERRHRQTVLYLEALPDDIKRDIGWPDAGRRFK